MHCSCAFPGLICIVIGAVVLLFDLKWHDDVSQFLGADRLNDFEEYYVSKYE